MGIMADLSPAAATAIPLYEARNISKSFGGIKAIVGATFPCFAGEVHGLVGQNGAGKSTMIKILSGAVRPDAGAIYRQGSPLSLAFPADAKAAGIGTVFQELSSIADLSVAVNLLYGTPGFTRFGRLDMHRLNNEAASRLAGYGLADISPTSLIRDLSLAQRQMLEIAKVLGQSPRLLILDEATSALHPNQVAWLKQQVDRFVAGGGAAVFVSHRMQEVADFSQRITVFRGGETVASGAVGDFSRDALVEHMLGRKLAGGYPPKPPRTETRPRLKVSGLASGRTLKSADLVLGEGEILGIGGLQGQGQRELFLSLYGATASAGRIELDAQPLQFGKPADAIRAGIALIPEDRATEGLFQTLSVADNILVGNLKRVARGGLILGVEPGRLIDAMLSLLQIKTRTPYQHVAALSGGNQQKVLLARALAQQPRVLLLYDPTRGVDVGTKAEIYRLMRDKCAEGASILFYSSDAAELVGISDRVLVLHDGHVAAELTGDDITEDRIVGAMVGADPRDAKVHA